MNISDLKIAVNNRTYPTLLAAYKANCLRINVSDDEMKGLVREHLVMQFLRKRYGEANVRFTNWQLDQWGADLVIRIPKLVHTNAKNSSPWIYRSVQVKGISQLRKPMKKEIDYYCYVNDITNRIYMQKNF